MPNVTAVLRRELSGFFGQPLAYIVIALFLALFSFLALWYDDVLVARVASMQGPFFWIAACFLFLAPAVTMRLVAEERRTGSLELVATLPMSSAELIVGKWLAAVALIAVALALTVSMPVAIAMNGDLDWGPVVGGYLGLLLLGAAFAAVGTACSAITENQVVSFLVALAVCLVPWLVGFGLPLLPANWVSLVQYLSFEYHFSNLARGVLDTRSLVFFAGVSLVGLRVAIVALENRRLS